MIVRSLLLLMTDAQINPLTTVTLYAATEGEKGHVVLRSAFRTLDRHIGILLIRQDYVFHADTAVCPATAASGAGTRPTTNMPVGERFHKDPATRQLRGV
jgi:hypothetical protein